MTPTQIYMQSVKLVREAQGARLRELRTAAGWSLLNLARELNSSVSTLSNAEKGKIVMEHTFLYHVRQYCVTFQGDLLWVMYGEHCARVGSTEDIPVTSGLKEHADEDLGHFENEQAAEYFIGARRKIEPSTVIGKRLYFEYNRAEGLCAALVVIGELGSAWLQLLKTAEGEWRALSSYNPYIKGSWLDVFEVMCDEFAFFRRHQSTWLAHLMVSPANLLKTTELLDAAVSPAYFTQQRKQNCHTMRTDEKELLTPLDAHVQWVDIYLRRVSPNVDLTKA